MHRHFPVDGSIQDDHYQRKKTLFFWARNDDGNVMWPDVYWENGKTYKDVY